ncbi:hypothetical protein GCM10020219_008720 [Nonomuraea dietziae]
MASDAGSSSVVGSMCGVAAELHAMAVVSFGVWDGRYEQAPAAWSEAPIGGDDGQRAVSSP